MNKTVVAYVKSIPILGPLLRDIFLSFQRARKRRYDRYDRLMRKRAKKYGLIHPSDISLFPPSSAGSHHLLSKLTALSVNQTIPLIGLLSKELNQLDDPKIYSIEEFCTAIGSTEIEVLSEKLKSKFNEYGSDKAALHNYYLVYAAIFKSKSEITGLLEIGMGTNNTKFASNMGIFGKPGASLRAFRDFLPNAFVYGADIDKNILFEEERIKTFFVDQTRLETFESLHNSIKTKLDLIIDDGLHSPNANLATFIFALRKMNNNKKGVIVIEDIPEPAVPLWKIVSNFLVDKPYRAFIVKTSQAYMFVCFKELGEDK